MVSWWRSVAAIAINSFLIALLIRYSRRPFPASPTGISGVSALRYHGFVRLIGIIGLLMCVVFTVLSLVPGSLGGGVWVAMGFSAFGLLFCVLLVESFTVFSIDRDGVTRRRIVGQGLHIRWRDVERVVLQKRLDGEPKGAVEIVTAGAKMTFSLWLSGRPELADHLLEHVPAPAFAGEREAILMELRQPKGPTLRGR